MNKNAFKLAYPKITFPDLELNPGQEKEIKI